MTDTNIWQAVVQASMTRGQATKAILDACPYGPDCSGCARLRALIAAEKERRQ